MPRPLASPLLPQRNTLCFFGVFGVFGGSSVLLLSNGKNRG